MRKVLIPLLLAIMLLPAVVQAQLTLPYTTGFEGLTTGQLPTGWSQLQSGSSGSGTFPAVYQYANNARNGSVYFEFESTTGQTELAALPVVSDVSQLQLSFYASVMNHNFLFEVGVMDSTTFEPVDTIALTVGSGGNWHGSYNQYTVYFNNYTGSGNRMAMRVTSSGSYTLMIDDLEIDYIPTCPAPTNFAATGSSVDWITLNWQENGVATAWVVEYDTVPIPASQLGLGVAGQEMVSGVPGVTINGLDTATTYYFYVYADCGGEYSTAASLTATTLAALPAEVPYSCDFEQDGPNGWDLINGSQTNKWCVGSATNNGGNQSLYISNDNGTSNSYSTGSTSYTYAVRSFDLTDSGEYAYGYDWKCQGESHYYDFCRAFLAPATYQWTAGTNPANGTNAFASWSMPSGWIELTEDFSSPRTMSQSSNWRTVTGTFYISTPGTYSIVFAWANDASGGSQPPMAVDNVFLTRNTCPGPSNFAATGSSVDWITLNWQQNGEVTSWVVEYDTVPIPVSQLGQGVASQEMVSGVPGVTINGLDTATTYYFYVYTDCGGEYSIAASLTATTLAALPAEVPYACDFEQEGPNGWELINGSQTNKWCVGSATNNGGNQSLYISDNNGTSNSYSTSSDSYTYAVRTFDLTDSGEYAYGYDWKCQGESHNYDFCRAFLAPASYQWTAGSNPAGGTYAFASWSMPSGWFELTENFSSPRTMALSSSWRTVTGTFYISTPGTYSLVFAWANDAIGGSQPPMAVDNVFLTHNTCPGPLNLTASYVANDTVVITWQPGGSESSWIVSDGVNSYDVYDTTYLFEGLMPATNYNFHVYALCDAGDTSLPATVSVRTPCSEFGPLPLSEDFDSYAANSYPDCWTRILNSNNYPYMTSDYGISVKFGGGASVFSPRIPAPLNTLFVEFDLQREGNSSGTMEFGYTSNPNSIDSMVVLQTIYPANTYQYYHYEFDLSADTCSDSVYLVWHQDGTSNWYYWLDNVSITRASTCPAVVNLRCSSHTNHEASIVWSDTSNSHIDVMLYIAQSNNIAAAFDSVVVSGNSYTFTGLSGNTHYYVWARANCSDGSSREVLCEFTTDVNCAPVENLRVVATDYHAFGLNWEAPTAGDPVTNYIVSYRLSGESSWISDTVSDLYYYISGLDTNHTYQYRVTTICDTLTSAITSGTVTTMGCARMITNGGTTNSYLPTYIYYGFSYTQQIYLDAEIGTGMDTITAISFYASSSLSSRNIDLYLGNTDQSSFSSTGNYIPVDSLSLVYTGTFSGTGWITLNFTTPFVRTAGRNLVVAMDDNTGNWVSSIAYAATSASNRSIYFYQDGTDINPASPSASNSSVVSYVNQIKLNPASCHIPTCNSPVVMIASTEGTQVNLVWNNEPGRTYTIEYLRENTTNWVVFDSTNTTGACSVTGLLSGYSYTFRVSFDCDGDLLSGTVQSRAVCAPVALPYTEDFENQSGLYSRNCWYTGSTNLGTSYPNPIVVNLEGNPNKLLLLYNGAYVILPEMDAPLNQLQIRFNFVQGANNTRLIMGVMDDPTAPISTIHPIDTLIRSDYDTSAYAYVIYPLDGISDTAGHLAFWDAFNDNYSFLDNIVVEYIPNCTNASDVVASNVTTNSATISWTGSANAISYLVEYGSRGFTPGTGTTVTSATNSIALTGLNPGSSYEAYVYAICANDTSIASQVCNFTTACAAITALPYTQNFENILGPGDNSANVVPNCWASALLPEGAGHEVPHVFYNTDLGHAPSPQYCFYFEGIGIAALPEMGVPLDSLMISFHEWNSNPSNYGLIIGAVDNTDSGFASSFQPIDTIPFVGTDNQFDVVSMLNGYTGTARHIAIASYNIAGSAYADQYLDNLVIDRIPNCIAPMRVEATALTNVSADLAWQFSTAANYSIEYGVHGFTPGTGTTVTSTTRTVSLTGLTPYTQYDVYLTSVCSPAETSDTTFFTFTTLRGAPVTTYPYVCTFADSTEANAWEPVNGSQTNKWYVGTAAHYGTVDNMGLYISDNNGVSNQYTISSASFTYVYRTFTLNVGSYNIGFNWQAQGESNYDYLRAWLAPADFEFTPGQTPDGGTDSYDYTSSNPAGWIPLDGGSKLNLQSSWQTASEDVAITTAGNYNLVFMWANDGSMGTNPPAAIDNVEVYLNTCPAPVEVSASSAGSTYIDLDWTDLAPAVSWQVEYGPSGYSRGTGTLLNVTSHPVNISGLDTLTHYDFYIRPICSGADTGRWSRPAALSTAMCDNSQVFALGSSASTGTSYYFPVNNYYRYTLTETIIDSAELNGSMDIEYIGYYYDYSSPSTAKTNCTIYFQPTAKTVFTSSSDMVALDSATGVRVYTGSLNCTQGWNYFQLDTAYHYDGTGNLLVIVDDNSNDYDGIDYVFKTQSCTGYKTIHYYNDTDNPDVTDPSTFSTSKSYEQARPVMQLISCAGAGCRKPIIVSTTYDYESATITWSGNGTNYEVNIKETASDWPATDIPVVGNTYTFTGLMPATNYTFRVRQDCSADSLGYSEWALGNFITDSLPCLAPTNLSTTTVTNATATFDWTVRGTETAWDIHVWNTGNIDSIYTVTTRPATVGGFTAGLTYNASIRPLCGSAHNIVGDWGDTITFSTTICPTVTGLTVGNVTANGATLNWDADQMAVSWIVEYGFAGFDQGSGTIVPCTANSFNATGLECETSYDFYVRAVCGTDWTSEHWTRVSFTTGDCSEACLAPTNVVATVDLNSVTVSWTPAEGNTAFEVEYGNRGFSHGNGTVVNTNEPSTVINGLEFNTQYDLYVRALCGADNYSPWTPVTTFTTGTQGIDNAEGVACTIFPNPTSSATTISVSGVSGKVKIEVVDMNGRTVASETLECSSDCRKTMDVDHLAQGAYFVRITGENVNMVKKLIVR
ncbi:MAG: fibronectin type III domain-containing protein [Bacteroidales bacterium]|nr:fibronectin type III domain-containing protein [Bacteroidales bacterium]